MFFKLQRDARGLFVLNSYIPSIGLVAANFSLSVANSKYNDRVLKKIIRKLSLPLFD
jgi:hypothetical protein